MWCLNEGIAGWTWLGGLWMLIIGGGLIALIVWGISRLTLSSSHVGENIPLKIARERYARGEINKEQFEQIKKDLY